LKRAKYGIFRKLFKIRRNNQYYTLILLQLQQIFGAIIVGLSRSQYYGRDFKAVLRC